MAVRGVKKTWSSFVRARKIANAKRKKEAVEGDVNRLTASDEIEQEYGYRGGTSFHKDLINRLKTMKEVSSPGATNRVANVAIYFAWGIKIISILITYGALWYIWENSISQNWDVPTWIIMPLIFIFSAAAEIISSIFIKNVLNSTENWLTRITTFIIGLVLTGIITYGHIAYTDLKNTVNIQKNKQAVMTIKTPTTVKLEKQIADIEDSIKLEKQKLEVANRRYNTRVADIDAGANAYKVKGEKYQEMVDRANKLKYKYIRVNGKNVRVSRVQGWANTNMKLYRKELEKKGAIEAPTNPAIENFKEQKRLLEDKLEKELNKEKTSMDDASLEKGDINLWVQFLISFLAKIDMYGYFVLRHNIKNRVLDQMHKIIDNFNVVNQLSGVLEQFSLQTGQVMKAIGLTGIKIQNELAGINRTIVTDGNRQLQSNLRLIKSLAHAPIDVEANYQPIGDSRVDISSTTPYVEHNDQHLAEIEQILTEYVKEMGYPHSVVLDESVDVGSTIGKVIKLNPNLSDNDTIKALRHELAHIESGTHKHNKEYKKGLDKVLKKEPKKPFEFTKVKPKDYPFSSERAVEILRAYSLAEKISYSQEEISYFVKRQAWGEDGIEVKDYLHLMDVLDI